MRTSDNRVLITGGASGIGLAVARLLVGSGNSVVVCGRGQAALDMAAAAVPGLATIRADVADAGSRQALADEVATRYPDLNVLVNNAGLLHVCDLADPAHVGALEAEVATNLVGPVALTSLLLPVLLRQKTAAIVNVTTGYVFLPSARTAPYSATKAALRVMTRSLRFRLRATPVRVMEVMPPAVDTAMARHYGGAKVSPEFVARKIVDGLRADRKEVVIGMSHLGRLMSRLAPELGFGVMNRGEERWPG